MNVARQNLRSDITVSVSTRTLLFVTALTELGAGFSLITLPSPSMNFLAGVPIEEPAALTIARICGAALLSLGIACWQARDDIQSRAAKGIVVSMLFYDIAAVVVLIYAGIGFRLQGLLLWPGVMLHSLMTAWCLVCLPRKPNSEGVQSDGTHSGMSGSSSIHVE